MLTGFRPVPNAKLTEALITDDALDLFDLESPCAECAAAERDCPVLRTVCRLCRVEMRIHWHGGFNPGLSSLIHAFTCEACALGEHLALDRAAGRRPRAPEPPRCRYGLCDGSGEVVDFVTKERRPCRCRD